MKRKTGYFTLAAIVSLLLVACPMEKEPENNSSREVTDLKASTPADGTVTLTWTDPEDRDLKLVVMTPTAAKGVSHPGYGVQKGTQTHTFTNLNGGIEYTFNVQTVDMIGNTSDGVTIKVITK